mmetsp:Transcript_36673/g.91355  ORF Transcript_36673/g.91355 Transcript_36673/m.91355 type:complete len:261 (+) Transcript_36673:12-794(+)
MTHCLVEVDQCKREANSRPRRRALLCSRLCVPFFDANLGVHRHRHRANPSFILSFGCCAPFCLLVLVFDVKFSAFFISAPEVRDLPFAHDLWRRQGGDHSHLQHALRVPIAHHLVVREARDAVHDEPCNANLKVGCGGVRGSVLSQDGVVIEATQNLRAEHHVGIPVSHQVQQLQDPPSLCPVRENGGGGGGLGDGGVVLVLEVDSCFLLEAALGLGLLVSFPQPLLLQRRCLIRLTTQYHRRLLHCPLRHPRRRSGIPL